VERDASLRSARFFDVEQFPALTFRSRRVERSGAKDKISFVRDTYTFSFAGPPSEFVAEFKNHYGPTMNAFDAAEKSGRGASLQKELEDLFEAQNKSSSKDTTSIPATFLRVAMTV